MATWSDRLNDEKLRLCAMLGLMLLCFVALGVGIWDIQVVRSSQFSRSELRQSMRRVRLPASRGRILDRHGAVIAGNRPNYCMAIYVEELRRAGSLSNTIVRVQEVLGELAGVMGRPSALTAEDIRMHLIRRRPLPLLAWKDLPHDALARWAERLVPVPGADIHVEPERVYPEGSLAAHLIGFVGRRMDFDDTPEHVVNYYLPEMEGRGGVELTANDKLAGRAGGRLLQVDAAGYKHREIPDVAPQPGRDVDLTIDLRIQRLVEAQLQGVRGAVVVLDPNSGDVLAMASAPTYAPTILRDVQAYRRSLEDKGKPLFNRAIGGAYPPGSIFKPVVGIAALDSGRFGELEALDCPGGYQVGGSFIGCWRTTGHGPLALRKALEQSCNTYFCDLAIRIGYDAVQRTASSLGFGERTGIALQGEVAGLLPDDAWKRRVMRDGWRAGDTCNVAIGQGALLATPLQMAVYTAALANGGRIYEPRLLARSEPGQPRRDLHWSRRTLEAVREGMTDVVNGDAGTGKRARVPGWVVAGKTGSAEYGVGARGSRQKYAWMIAYAPVEAPRYALALVIEDAISGGLTAAPRVQAVLAGILALEVGAPLPVAEGGAS